MPEDEPKSTQNISAGDGSQNYQAGRDVNIHNNMAAPQPQSLIQRPTNKDVIKYDSRIAKIIRVAEYELWSRLDRNMSYLSAPSSFRWTKYILFLVFMLLLFKYSSVMIAWIRR